MKTTLLSLLFIYASYLSGFSKSTDTTNSMCSPILESAQASDTPGDSLILKAIPHPLFWIHAPAEFKVLSENALSFTAGKETDLYTFVDGNYYTNNTPKLLFTPDTDFIFSARVKPTFEGIYDGGAILLYSDSLNWAKILFEKVDENTLLIGSSVVSGKQTDDSYHGNIEQQDIWLKVAKSGKIFNFYHSLDGKKWSLTRTFHYDEAESLKLGFYTQSPKGPECPVTFSDIRYKGVGFTDFVTGK